MFRHKPYALRATLLFTSLLFGSVSAFAQKLPLPGVPSVNLGLSAPKVGVELPGITTSDPVKLLVPTVGSSVVVPSVGGLTPSLNVTVNVGGSEPGVPAVPETSLAAAPQVAEKRLELLPTCR